MEKKKTEEILKKKKSIKVNTKTTKQRKVQKQFTEIRKCIKLLHLFRF